MIVGSLGGGEKYLVRVCGYHREGRGLEERELPQRWWRGCGIYRVEGKAGAAWLGREKTSSRCELTRIRMETADVSSQRSISTSLQEFS